MSTNHFPTVSIMFESKIRDSFIIFHKIKMSTGHTIPHYLEQVKHYQPNAFIFNSRRWYLYSVIFYKIEGVSKVDDVLYFWHFWTTYFSYFLHCALFVLFVLKLLNVLIYINCRFHCQLVLIFDISSGQLST